jgi:antitoxin component of MazEF toxin-antitoxin module
MKVQIAKWGNSAAVRLPKVLVDELGPAPGSELDIVVEDGAFRLSPTRQRPSTPWQRMSWRTCWG